MNRIMTREEFDRLYLGKAVHCDTEEKANAFLALADSFGYKWVDGSSLVGDNAWKLYNKETCYRVQKWGLTYSDTSHYSRHGYQIINYQLQPKFKVGDKVRIKDAYTPINGKVGVIVNLHSLFTGSPTVKIDNALWCFLETELEKVEEPTYEGETIEDIIEEIEYHQKAINVLHDRLKRKTKVK